jgi:hypothetical protein
MVFHEQSDEFWEKTIIESSRVYIVHTYSVDTNPIFKWSKHLDLVTKTNV